MSRASILGLCMIPCVMLACFAAYWFSDARMMKEFEPRINAMTKSMGATAANTEHPETEGVKVLSRKETSEFHLESVDLIKTNSALDPVSPTAVIVWDYYLKEKVAYTKIFNSGFPNEKEVLEDRPEEHEYQSRTKIAVGFIRRNGGWAISRLAMGESMLVEKDIRNYPWIIEAAHAAGLSP